jgi:hypothetical protein
MQVLAKSAVAYAVAQEVLRVGGSINVQMRVATGDTVVSGIHIPEGTNVWLCPRQVCTLFSLHERSRSPCAATCMHNLLFFSFQFLYCLTQIAFTHHTQKIRRCP